MHSRTNGQADLITISLNSARLKNFIYKGSFWICIVLVGLVYAVVRDFVLTPARPATLPQASQESVLLNTMMVAPKNNVSGATFNVPSSERIHITVKNSTANKVVINKLDGDVVISYTDANVDEDLYLEKGQYVLSLIANENSRARAFVEVREGRTS